MSRSLFARLNRRFGPKIDPITRRDMLKASLAASSAYLLSGVDRIFAQPTSSARRVVVIGGGFSGLACAHELRRAKYDVTVVEARKRVGGRVLSFGDFIKGKNAEGGAELIGSNHPTWVAYAKQFNLDFLDVSEDEEAESPIIIDGKRLTKDESAKMWEELDGALNKMNADADKINADQPWKSPNAEALDRKSALDWVNEQKFPDLLKKAVTIQLVGDNGAELKDQSYLGNLAAVKGGGLEKYWSDTEVYRCKGGNQQLANMLAESIGRDRINLNLPVTQVTITDKGAVVKCKDGREIECDEVVLSAPPSTWSKIKFSPDLPATLTPRMGVNLKYLAHLKKAPWTKGELSPDTITNGPVAMTWNGTDGQPGDDDVCMIAFSGADAAEECRRHSADIDGFYKAELDKVYPEFSKQFVASRFMDWPSDPWTLAGYSFPAPGQVTTIGPVLYNGLKRLSFCGEHACYKFVGYMEGGLNSGASLAKRMAIRDGVIKG